MRRSPKHDPQRSEVYAWERRFRNCAVGDMGTRAFYRMLRRVCKEYRVPRPRCMPLWANEYREGFAAVCDSENKALRFDPRWCTASVLLHELAHWIVFRYGGTGAHNALWLGIYLRLKAKYKVLPLDASIPSAKKAGLQFLPPEKCTPAMLKTAKRLALQPSSRALAGPKRKPTRA